MKISDLAAISVAGLDAGPAPGASDPKPAPKRSPRGHGRRSTRRFEARYCLTGVGRRLAEEHAEWAVMFGRRFGRRWPRFAADCEGAACEGLISAVANYDAAREVDFRTYAAPFLHGECMRTIRHSSRFMTPYRASAGDAEADRPAVVSLANIALAAVDPSSSRGPSRSESRDEVEFLLGAIPCPQAEILREHYERGVSQVEMSLSRGKHRTWARHALFAALCKVRDRVAESEFRGTYVA